MTKRIYLDNNASTFLDPRIAAHLIESINTIEGNPSSIHQYGQKTRAQITKARTSIAAYLKAKPSELIFTSGGTESMNMLIKGLITPLQSNHIITSSVEHSCVYATVKQLESQGAKATFLSPGLFGAVSPEAVEKAILPETKMIVLMAVNNETGVKTDIAEIARIAAARDIHFVVDGVALLGKEQFIIPPGISGLAFSAHKLHAPQGVGLCYVRSGVKLSPLMTGGEQESGRRPGTENVLGIVGFAKAVELLYEELPVSSLRMQLLRDKFEQTLIHSLSGVFVNGEGLRTVNVSNMAFEGVDGEALLMSLDAAGVAASHGSACASGTLEPSRILLNMGLPLSLVNGSIRFSLSRFTTEEEIELACAIIVKAVNRLR